MRCAIYARYSSDMQKQTSIDDQVRNCRNLAAQRGWNILKDHVYADKAVSGSSLKGRIQLTQLLDAATKKPRLFDYILIDDTSRLSRDRSDQTNLISDFQYAGIELYFVSQNIDTADEQANDVVLPIHGIVDTLYLKELAKKTQRGMAGQVLHGYSPGGRLYGYNYEKVPDPSGVIDKKTRQTKVLGTKILVNPEQAEVVLKVYKMYASGAGYKEIAKYLNGDKVEPPGGDRQRRQKPHIQPSWCPNQIRSMLHNPKYNGDWTWNRYKWIKNRKTGKRMYRERNRSEWVKSDRPDLKIIPDDLWRSVQTRLKENRRVQNRGNNTGSKYLFSGMLRCAVCGGNMIVVRKTKNDAIVTCSMSWHRGPSVCTNDYSLKMSHAEERLLSMISEKLLVPEVVNRTVKKVNRLLRQHLTLQPVEIRGLTSQSEELELEIGNLIDFIAENGDPSGRVGDRLREKEMELDEVKTRLDSAEALSSSSGIDVDAPWVIKRFSNLPELMNRDVSAARIRLKELIDHFVMTPVILGGEKAFRAEGQVKLQGLLGVKSLPYTLKNSGGRI